MNRNKAGDDPEIKTANRRRRREAAERGSYGSAARRKVPKQMTHASSGKSRKASREGNKRMRSGGS